MPLVVDPVGPGSDSERALPDPQLDPAGQQALDQRERRLDMVIARERPQSAVLCILGREVLVRVAVRNGNLAISTGIDIDPHLWTTVADQGDVKAGAVDVRGNLERDEFGGDGAPRRARRRGEDRERYEASPSRGNRRRLSNR